MLRSASLALLLLFLSAASGQVTQSGSSVGMITPSGSAVSITMPSASQSSNRVGGADESASSGGASVVTPTTVSATPEKEGPSSSASSSASAKASNSAAGRVGMEEAKVKFGAMVVGSVLAAAGALML